jgi:serine phosphatase RsbU (regulator of sigma subunit)
MIVIFAKIIYISLFILLLAIATYLYLINKKLLQKHEELLIKHKVKIKKFEKEAIEKNNFVKNQLEEIMTQNIEITESIIYARKIQKAVLPPDSLFEQYFKEYFILFKPKQIVSGDFYWLVEKHNHIYISVADSTGHGVPGAFMSLLGISFLNEIINKQELLRANQILDRLRLHIIDSLRQTGKAGGSKDGMDMSLCVINKETKQLEYAGAYNPIFIIRKNSEEEKVCFDNNSIKVEQTDLHTFIHVKPDRMPVGFDYRSEGHSFSNQLLKLNEGDTIYMFSDGYADQFGGESNKKYSISRLKSLLLDIQAEKLEEQNNILDDMLENWKGKYAQIDDILIIGFKI